MLVTGYWLLDTGYWILVTGYWLLVAGYKLLVTCYWLLGFHPLITDPLITDHFSLITKLIQGNSSLNVQNIYFVCRNGQVEET